MASRFGRCCCGPPPGLCATYTVRVCPYTSGGVTLGANPGAGVLVRIRASAGGAVVAEGTTDAAGQVRLCVPTRANRVVEVKNCPRMADATFTTITDADPKTLFLSAASAGYCCPTTPMRSPMQCEGGRGFPYPYVWLTDALGTRGAGSQTYDVPATCLYSHWAARPAPVSRVWRCVYPPPVGGHFTDYRRSIVPGRTNVSYQLNTNPDGRFRLVRQWSGGEGRRHLNPDVDTSYVLDSAYSNADEGWCTTGEPNVAEIVFGPIDCSTFYWSGTPIQISGTLPDPLGAVVLSG